MRFRSFLEGAEEMTVPGSTAVHVGLRPATHLEILFLSLPLCEGLLSRRNVVRRVSFPTPASRSRGRARSPFRLTSLTSLDLKTFSHHDLKMFPVHLPPPPDRPLLPECVLVFAGASGPGRGGREGWEGGVGGGLRGPNLHCS